MRTKTKINEVFFFSYKLASFIELPLTLPLHHSLSHSLSRVDPTPAQLRAQLSGKQYKMGTTHTTTNAPIHAQLRARTQAKHTRDWNAFQSTGSTTCVRVVQLADVRRTACCAALTHAAYVRTCAILSSDAQQGKLRASLGRQCV